MEEDCDWRDWSYVLDLQPAPEAPPCFDPSEDAMLAEGCPHAD